MLPPKLSIPEENLCPLFMNLLDNALEAAGQAEEGNRFIHLRTYIRSGFLAVLCENGCNGCLSTDQNGRLPSNCQRKQKINENSGEVLLSFPLFYCLLPLYFRFILLPGGLSEQSWLPALPLFQ